MRLLRRVVDTSTLWMGRIKRYQRVPVPKDFSPVKVNIGCGLAVAPGWINIDGSFNALVAGWPRVFHALAYRFTGARNYYTQQDYLRLLGEHYFIHHDLVHGLPLSDSVADFVYTSHFVEHLFRKDAQHLFRESFRVLKSGGILRVSVPDLEHAVRLYQAGEKEKMLASYFFVDDDGSYYARHKFMYDFGLLSDALRQAGFKDVKRCGFREGGTPDLDVLDNRGEESLFVEAQRP